MESAIVKPYSKAAAARKLVALIPARDEGPTVASVVRDVRRHLNCPVVVIDDGSSDDTGEEARSAGATVLTLPFSLGAWGAAQAGIRYAASAGYEVVVTLDADGQHHAESIPALVHGLNLADVVIGACPERLSWAKHLAWAYFRWLTGLDIQDFTSGLRIYNRRAIELLAERHASLLDYQDVGVLMLLSRRGLRICERPVAMSQRQAGHSRVFSSWFAVSRYMLQTTVLCIARIGNGNGGRRRASLAS
ncbi:MAG: glycosyltransferase family 2 protein [Xanthomonadales bacterium]|nr:glycosyltransferase family 2 protein [Xanthomonadales bacterium]